VPRRQSARVTLVAHALALFEDRRPATPVDRAVHAASAHERRVGRVDDRIDLFARDVALYDLDRDQTILLFLATPALENARAQGFTA
jgi:hypothetical protein